MNHVQIFLSSESGNSIYKLLEFLKNNYYTAYNTQTGRDLCIYGDVFKNFLLNGIKVGNFLRINLTNKLISIGSDLKYQTVTIKEFMENKIHIRSQIRSGMVIHLEAADLLVCISDVNDELICVNKSIHKCTPLNHLLNEDLSVSEHYQSNLKSISLNGETYYRPVVKLTLREIADRLGYDVQSIQIIEEK